MADSNKNNEKIRIWKEIVVTYMNVSNVNLERLGKITARTSRSISEANT
jgi:hypothetical protein